MDTTQILLPPLSQAMQSYGIGNTPLQAIGITIGGIQRIVHLKLEGFNPTNSMKDRTAFALIHTLEEEGRLRPGTTIIESTSGNLGVAMARLCQLKGYRFIAVIDPKATLENIAKMRYFDAQIELVEQADEHGGYLLTRLAHVQDLTNQHPNYLWSNQYVNPANPHIHYSTTGPEISEQMQGKVDAIFIPVSTGGTLAGIGKFFREAHPATQIIGVDAEGSIIFGTPPAPRKLTGIGSSRLSHFIRKELYDCPILARDEEAFAYCQMLYEQTNIHVGGSSGAVLAACVRYLILHPDIVHVVCVCADHGKNYHSSIFNQVWLREQGFEELRSFVYCTSIEKI